MVPGQRHYVGGPLQVAVGLQEAQKSGRTGGLLAALGTELCIRCSHLASLLEDGMAHFLLCSRSSGRQQMSWSQKSLFVKCYFAI